MLPPRVSDRLLRVAREAIQLNMRSQCLRLVALACAAVTPGCSSSVEPTVPTISGVYNSLITPSSACDPSFTNEFTLFDVVFLNQQQANVFVHYKGNVAALDLVGTITSNGTLTFDLTASQSHSVESTVATGSGSANLTGSQVVGTFAGDLVYNIGGISLPPAHQCHATDHHIVLTPKSP